MADIAPKLIQLSADKLRALHERLHKSEATPEVLEVHHLAVNEMLRRGLEAPENDVWDEFEILVDTMKNANLEALAGSLPADMIADVIKSTGSAVADVQLFLTTTGYEMRLEPFEELNKMIRREDGKYTVYDEEGKRKFGSYKTKAEAEKRLAQMHEFKKSDSYIPPMAVRTAARRALDWISEGKAGDGFTGIGRSRAGQLASGEGVSLATLKRMKSFLARHEVDKEAIGFSQGEKGFPSAGRVAWDAWGGDAGFTWAETMIARAEKEVAKHNQGQHDQKTHGSWADGIAQDILDGKHPKVEKENVSAFLMKAAKRDDHPDLTELSVEGTLLFGDEGKGIARKDMPQIPGKERGRFLAEIEESDGITATAEEIDPTTLKPVQKEISAARSGAIFEKFREEGGIPRKERILISSDGFVIDGHHTWGASVAFAFDNPGTTLPVYRLSVTADEAMAISLEWSKANGFEGQAIDAPAKKSLAWSPIAKHEDHDQSTHGSWSNSGSPKLTIMGRNDGENEFFNENTRVVRYQPKGKQPTDYVLFLQGGKGSEIFALKKPTDGTTIDGWGQKIAKLIVGKIEVLPPGAGSVARTSAKNDNFATIYEAIVKPAHQRRGLASAMLQFHRDMFPEQNLQHSDVLSGDGKAWSDVAKHGEHDQKKHGAWAMNVTGDVPPLDPDVMARPQWSAEAVAEAKRLRERALAVEPKVTELMKVIQENAGGEFVQLEQRVKSTDSLARKIDGDAVTEFDGDRTRAADAVSDAVRYTLKVGDENYAQSLDSTVKALEAAGFTLRVKNFWQSGDPYDGVNIKARKDGVEVEIQLHTPSSFAHKEGEGGTHPIYKKYQVELNDSAREKMWNQMIDIARGVVRPANYGAIIATGTLVLQQFQTAQEAGLIKSTLVDKLTLKREVVK
jgi:ribosomal protein S18 acetylase RimI-like enzyme